MNSVYKITTTDNTVYFFDMNTGKLTKIVDANGLLQSVTLSYGTEPSVTHSYTYNLGTSLLSGVTDPKGNTIFYSYDADKRVTSVTRTINGASSRNNYSYVYDSVALQWKVTVTGPSGEQTLYYTNDNGNVARTDVKLNGTQTATTVYNWAPNNWLTSVRLPIPTRGGISRIRQVVCRRGRFLPDNLQASPMSEYDNLNRATKVTESNPDNYTQNTYDAGGQRTQLSVH